MCSAMNCTGYCRVVPATTTTITDGTITYVPSAWIDGNTHCQGCKCAAPSSQVLEEEEIENMPLDINEEIDQEGLGHIDTFRDYRDRVRRKVQRLNDEAEELRNIADSKERRAKRLVKELNEETPVPSDD